MVGDDVRKGRLDARGALRETTKRANVELPQEE